MRTIGRGVALLAMLIASRQAAANITINIDADARVEKAVSLAIRVRNAGNEAARDVEPEVIYLDQVTRGKAIAALDPNQRHDWNFDLAALPGSGVFPITVRVRYADANGYPLSALLVTSIHTPGAPDGPVGATLSVGTMERSASAQVMIANRGEKPIAGRITFVLPTEFRSERESAPVEVPPGGKTELPFLLHNDGAFPGSTYLVYAVFEYDDHEGIHHTIGRGRKVPVVAVGSALRRVLLISGIVLTAAMAIAAFFWLRSRRPRVPAPAEVQRHAGDDRRRRRRRKSR